MVILLLGFCFAVPEQAAAADNPVSVSSCKLNSSGKKLTVKAKVKNKTKAMGKKLYLLGLEPYNSETGTKSSTPLASVKAKKGTITFKVTYKSSMLYKKFAVAYKTKGKYKIVSDVRYITNPEVLATYKGSGPKTTSKKGLQVEELSDSLELGTQHAVINWTLSSILSTSGIPYKYRGTTYYFDEGVLQYNDSLVQAYNAAGVKVTIILLLPEDGDAATASMRYAGPYAAKFSSVKTSAKKGCRTFEAVMTYLAKRYGTKDNLVSGWIVGNEVNSPYIWNYGGGKSQSSYISNYARTFRICYNAVKSVNKKAKVYISLDNNWNLDMDGKGNHYFTSKSTLDKFYSKIKAQGKIVFNIAYHAYPQGLSDPIFWDDSNATNSTSTKIISFKNLSVLTNYVKKNFGKSYTIMLSEQSFNSTRGEAVQAAAYAYAYYMSEGNSMIESFIYGREFDNSVETNQGYYWGLCDNWHSKRLIWHVFQYIDTKDSFKFTDPLLKYTNLKKWSKISGFKKSKYTSMSSKRKQAAITEIETVSTSSVTLSWGKLNTGDGYEIYRSDGNTSNYRLIKTISGNSTVTYKDTGLKAGTTYYYKVRMYKEAPASDNANKRVKLYGSFSSSAGIIVSTGQVVIDSGSCGVDGNKITVGWKKLSGVSGYEISRSTQENGTYTVLGTTTKTKYTDSNTQSGTTYFYRVRAYVTANGNNYYGTYSDVYSKQSRIQLNVSIVDGKMTANWTQWQNEASYRIYCSTEPDKNFKSIKKVSGLTWSGTKYNNAQGESIEFVQGVTYYFKVRVVFANGESSNDSNIASIKWNVTPVDSTGVQEEPETSPIENTDTETPSEESTESTESANTETPSEESTEIPDTEMPSEESTEPESTVTETPSEEGTEPEGVETETLPKESTEI